MTIPRTCASCGGDSAFERRVKCRRCTDLVHTDCCDVTQTCYGCRWRQARENGIGNSMLPAASAGRSPFEANEPATLARGLPLPPRASVDEPLGASVNELRVLTTALFAGWHIANRDDTWSTWELRKHGRGYLRLTFAVGGRIVHAATQRQYPTPNTAHIIEYLESS